MSPRTWRKSRDLEGHPRAIFLQVQLLSSDGETFEVARAVVKQSVTIENTIEGGGLPGGGSPGSCTPASGEGREGGAWAWNSRAAGGLLWVD